MAQCTHCFREKNTNGACPFCGYDGRGQAGRYPLALKPGSILNGRYIVGHVIGQGGFGITYIAQDYQTKERVAVKEYLPMELARRGGDGTTLRVFSADREESFDYGKEQFLAEAKTLAEFIGDEHIVKIHSYFEENGTAYFVMDYVDGLSLDRYMKQRGGKLNPGEAALLFLPLMESLAKVHAKGIVHRDITPDNILIENGSTAKLIDFGAARYSTGEKSKSLDVILKHGFAPMEQYTRRGRQGPWTDVYALAATFCYAVTGIVPPDAIDRMEDDQLILPSGLGVKIRPEADAALAKALAVNFGVRTQSMEEFHRELEQALDVELAEAETEHVRMARAAREMAEQQEREPLEERKKEADEKREIVFGEKKSLPDEEKSADRKKIKAIPLILAGVAAAALVAFGVTHLGGKESPTVTEAPAATEEIAEPVDMPEESELPEEDPDPLADAQVGDYITFGSYEQDNDESNGKEPIEWLVLGKEDGRLLVISKYVLDSHRYHTEWAEVTWEVCGLRSWLNSEFLNAAFNEEEQWRIPVVKLSTESNPKYNTDGGNDTNDQVFVLSIQEAEKYFSNNEERQCAPTAYAMTQGVSVNSAGNCGWWLRSPGKHNDFAASVFNDGDIYNEGNYIYPGSHCPVRPAIWIDVIGKYTPGDTAESQPPEKEQDPLAAAQIGDYITFGSYEQDNDLTNSKEPIEWLVLDKNDDRLLVISKYALDSHRYHTKWTEVTWEVCGLRSWLNSEFLNTAFSEEEQKRIPVAKVSTEPNPRYNTDGGNDTDDQVFVLSIQEAEKYFATNEERQCVPTDYAKAQGVTVGTSSTGNCWWWLRSPGKHNDFAARVHNDGNVYTDGAYVYPGADCPVRPALWINLGE